MSNNFNTGDYNSDDNFKKEAEDYAMILLLVRFEILREYIITRKQNVTKDRLITLFLLFLICNSYFVL